jgi:hypothetical protein
MCWLEQTKSALEERRIASSPSKQNGCDRPGHASGSVRLTSCTVQLLPSGSLKKRNEP